MARRQKIGFHVGPAGNPTGIGDDEVRGPGYMPRLDEARIPFFIASADDYGIIDEGVQLARASGVDHHFMYRLSTRGQKDGFDYDVPQYHLDPNAAAPIHWQAIIAKLPPEFDKRVWIAPINEVDKNRADWIGRFSWAISNQARAGGYRVALPAWASGEPEPEQWLTPGMELYLRECAKYPEKVAACIHEYSYSADQLDNGYPWLIGRFRFLEDACNRLGIAPPTTYIKEFGWTLNDMPNPDEAMRQLEWAMELYAEVDWIRGAALWWLGGGFDNIANKLQKLIKPVTDVTLEFAAPPPPPPPPTDREPKTIRHEVHILPQDTKTEELHAVTEHLHPRRSGFTYSHDFVEAVMYHSTASGTIHAWDPWRWDFDVQEYFDWLGVGYQEHGFHDELGVGKPKPPAGDQKFAIITYPVQGVTPHVTDPFNSPRSYGNGRHEGIDLRVYNPTGRMPNIVAGQRGRVDGIRSVDPGSGYGVYVRLTHEDFEPGVTWKTWYAHLSSVHPELRVGQQVAAGQVLGVAGSTGNSLGPHLHLTVQKIPGGLRGYVVDHVVDPYPLIAAFNTPPPPPPPVQTIDLLPYLRGDGRMYETQYTWAGGGTQTFQTHQGSGEFWQVKNGEYEHMYYDDRYIYRGIDTSEAPDKFYVQMTGDKYGAIWAKRHMAMGETVVKTPRIIHYWQNNCSVRASGNPVDQLTLAKHWSEITTESGIRISDVIKLEWSAGEGYLYARDWGLVGFEFTGGRSWVSEVHQNRPPLQRHVPSCWHDPVARYYA